MAPDLINKIDGDELRDLARKIREYQMARNISDNALVKKFSSLGSTKTYKRILDGDLAELDLEKQLNNYRSVVALIEAVGDENIKREELYDDLTPVVHLRRCVFETMKESGVNRVVVLHADTGMGKSSAGQILVERFGSRILWVEANECWGDSPMAFLGAVLQAMGVRDLPHNVMLRLDRVMARLKETRVAMIVDESHHLGPRILNTIKTLVNQTPGEFVLLAMPTLWRRLEREAYEEVRQLTGNRLAERIKLEGLKDSDLRKFISRRCPGMNGELGQAVKIVADRAPQRGNLAFVRDVCTRANELAAGEPVNIEHWSIAVSSEMESR